MNDISIIRKSFEGNQAVQYNNIRSHQPVVSYGSVLDQKMVISTFNYPFVFLPYRENVPNFISPGKLPGSGQEEDLCFTRRPVFRPEEASTSSIWCILSGFQKMNKSLPRPQYAFHSYTVPFCLSRKERSSLFLPELY